ASAIMAGSAPAICTATGAISPSWLRRRDVLTLSHSRGLLAAISDTACPAPSRLHSCRKGRSVTPAMGATSTLLGRVQGPMRMGGFYPPSMRHLFDRAAAFRHAAPEADGGPAVHAGARPGPTPASPGHRHARPAPGRWRRRGA